MVFGPYNIPPQGVRLPAFQFPVGIRWCSDERVYNVVGKVITAFQFPVGIRWCSDSNQPTAGNTSLVSFQFPVGIRWCSDFHPLNSGCLAYDTFNSLWELDGVRTLVTADPKGGRITWAFNSLWELDGVRTTRRGCTTSAPPGTAFNSLWELDGVRTCRNKGRRFCSHPDFQFPVGIRWCSDKKG